MASKANVSMVMSQRIGEIRKELLDMVKGEKEAERAWRLKRKSKAKPENWQYSDKNMSLIVESIMKNEYPPCNLFDTIIRERIYAKMDLLRSATGAQSAGGTEGATGGDLLRQMDSRGPS